MNRLKGKDKAWPFKCRKSFWLNASWFKQTGQIPQVITEEILSDIQTKLASTCQLVEMWINENSYTLLMAV